MGSLRDGWHTCPTTLELAAGLTGAFLAGLGIGLIVVMVTARRAR